MMKSLLSSGLVFGLSLMGVHALSPQTVLQGLNLSENPERKLLAAQIIESLDAESWFFQFRDPNYKGSYRWIKVQDAKVILDQSGFLPVFENESLSHLSEDDLKMDISLFKKKAREIAKVAEVSPTQYRYILKHPTNRKTAFWQIALLDKQNESLGQLALDARSGKTVTASWRESDQKKEVKKEKSVAKVAKEKAPSKKEGFGQSVERTFKGIGADLEEFFTGKRTVDRD